MMENLMSVLMPFPAEGISHLDCSMEKDHLKCIEYL